ncbi:hypothetical protein Tco_0168899 [Tanacetum coccineum]
MEADRLLTLRLQEEERRSSYCEERSNIPSCYNCQPKKEGFLQNKELLPIRNRPLQELSQRGAKDLEQKRLKKKVAKETPRKKDTQRKIVRWRLYKACGVYIFELEDGTVIHMLVERRYPLSKGLLQRMLDFGFEVEVDSTAALDLIRFIKQQIDEE